MSEFAHAHAQVAGYCATVGDVKIQGVVIN